MMGKFTIKGRLLSKRATEKFTVKRILLSGSIVGILLGATVLTGCTNDKTTDTEIYATEEKRTENVDFSVEEYQKSITDGRVSLKDYADQYEQETQEIQNTTYQNISFSDCFFEPFPDKAEKLNVFYTTYEKLSAQECWNAIDNWLVSIGKRAEVNMDADVRTNRAIDESKEYPECYSLMKDYLQDPDFEGHAFLTGKDYDVTASSHGGIYTMSDGKIESYFQKDDEENGIPSSNNPEVFQVGKVSELKEVSYPLISGERTIGESAEQVRTYFESGTLFPLEKGITIDVPEVGVFHLDENACGYEFSVRNWYENMPFLYEQRQEANAYANVYDGYSIMYPLNDAYVVDDEGVTEFFLGESTSAQIHVLYQDREMVGIRQAVDIMSQKLASFLKLEVHEVGIGYAKYISDLEEKTDIYYPFWKFCGVNKVKNQALFVYVDMISGAVYYTFE